VHRERADVTEHHEYRHADKQPGRQTPVAHEAEAK
jgi:hypothetical protein